MKRILLLSIILLFIGSSFGYAGTVLTRWATSAPCTARYSYDSGSTTGDWDFGNGAGSDFIASSFVTGASQTAVTMACVCVRKAAGDQAWTVSAGIYADNAGVPNGAGQVGTNANETPAMSTFPSTAEASMQCDDGEADLTCYTFDDVTGLSPSTTYHVVLSTSSYNATDYLTWMIVNQSPNGTLATSSDGSTWTDNTTWKNGLHVYDGTCP